MARALVVTIVLVVLAPSVAKALPVFARRYQTSCSTCHSQFPKLNPFGEAFRRNGYQFPAGGDAQAIQQPQLKVVADARRDLWPRSFWPSEIPNYIPLAFVLESEIPIFPDPTVRPQGEATISLDKIYAAAELILAARLGKDVSIWAGVDFSTDGGVQFERGSLMFSNLFHASALHLKIGQFEPQILSFSDYRRLGGPAYQLISTQILHGNWNFEVIRGLDLSGTIGGRFGWNLAYGQGIEGSYNNDGIKQVPRDAYAHVYFKLGGLRLDGIEPPGGAPAVEKSAQIGGFVYAGEHNVDVDNDRTKPAELDVLYKAGGDFYAIIGNVELLAAAAYEHHHFQTTGIVSRTQALLELSWSPVPWVAGILRAEIEYAQGSLGTHITPIFSLHPRINLKVQLWGVVAKELTDEQFHFAEVDIVGRYAF